MTAGSGTVSRRRALGLLVAGLAAAVVAPGPAWALDLDQAKRSGWIGERRDGYVGVVDGAPGEAQALVNQINQERRAAYSSVASSNGVPINQVEALAGQKLIERAAPGEYIMDAAGRWIRK